MNKTRAERLARSQDMAPVTGTVDVAIPVSLLWQTFTNARKWPKWNKCFFWVHNRDLIQDRKLIWIFQPVRWWMLYKMPAMAKIVEVEKEKDVSPQWYD